MRLPVPVFMAFNAEMIVGLPGQGTVSAVRFQYSLRKGYRRRNSAPVHFFNGKIPVGSYILFQGHPAFLPADTP